MRRIYRHPLRQKSKRQVADYDNSDILSEEKADALVAEVLAKQKKKIIMDVLIDFVWNFIIIGFLVKMVLLKGLANVVMRHLDRIFSKSERNNAIWDHYQLRAQGYGHDPANILECDQDSCGIL